MNKIKKIISKVSKQQKYVSSLFEKSIDEITEESNTINEFKNKNENIIIDTM
jgi:hypothetical protein